MVGLSSGNLVTYQWGASGWTLLSPATQPPGLYFPTLAYDPDAGHVYMFGGHTLDSGLAYQNTMWMWDDDAGDWTDVTPVDPAVNPDPRDSTAMAYDASNSGLVLYGGHNSNGDLGDTWIWNGSGWTAATPTADPGARSLMQMARISTGALMYDDDFAGTTWTWGKAPDVTNPFLSLNA